MTCPCQHPPNLSSFYQVKEIQSLPKVAFEVRGKMLIGLIYLLLDYMVKLHLFAFGSVLFPSSTTQNRSKNTKKHTKACLDFTQRCVLTYGSLSCFQSTCGKSTKLWRLMEDMMQ